MSGSRIYWEGTARDGYQPVCGVPKCHVSVGFFVNSHGHPPSSPYTSFEKVGREITKSRRTDSY